MGSPFLLENAAKGPCHVPLQDSSESDDDYMPRNFHHVLLELIFFLQ